ncbi:hypothetical protein GCU60_05070 [Blastococcus saxobsidens]|uniref:Uncharacterized protein n=1 Tax=Blastococcus saxobsidens TaxID=138336 RepID=A0A6L9W0X9_9ACTN|nr:hypothetical protein [Blastococcus saxobsidens]NEK85134.1 hypothetical protein [Blastococcus saxobsidens]
MLSLIGLLTYLLMVALFLGALYWVVNRAVLHALRSHHEEVRRGARPQGSSFPQT